MSSLPLSLLVLTSKFLFRITRDRQPGEASNVLPPSGSGRRVCRRNVEIIGERMAASLFI